MTKEDWKYIEEQWGNYGRIYMEVDGYKLTIEIQRHKMKLFRVVYIDGSFKGADFVKDKDGNYSDRSNRFIKREMKSIHSRKSIKDFEKSCGKRAAKRLRMYEKFETRSPYWTSFRSFKSHIIKHNNNIELIKD